MCQRFLIKTIKDGRSSIDKGLRSKSRFNHPHSVEERGTPETRNLDALRERRSPILVRGMKFNKSIYLNKNPLSVTLEEFFPRDFFKKVTVNMPSCSELEDEEDEEDAQEDPQRRPLRIQMTDSSAF